jgi:hypothetical protein
MIVALSEAVRLLALEFTVNVTVVPEDTVPELGEALSQLGSLSSFRWLDGGRNPAKVRVLSELDALLLDVADRKVSTLLSHHLAERCSASRRQRSGRADGVRPKGLGSIQPHQRKANQIDPPARGTSTTSGNSP